jgi:hypothetical protein
MEPIGAGSVEHAAVQRCCSRTRAVGVVDGARIRFCSKTRIVGDIFLNIVQGRGPAVYGRHEGLNLRPLLCEGNALQKSSMDSAWIRRLRPALACFVLRFPGRNSGGVKEREHTTDFENFSWAPSSRNWGVSLGVYVCKS